MDVLSPILWCLSGEDTIFVFAAFFDASEEFSPLSAIGRVDTAEGSPATACNPAMVARVTVSVTSPRGDTDVVLAEHAALDAGKLSREVCLDGGGTTVVIGI